MNSIHNTSDIISKSWSFCHTLRDDGVGYGDYLEQLTYMLFLKRADDFSWPPYNRKLPIPKAHSWECLTEKKGTALEMHYTTLLRELGRTINHPRQVFPFMQIAEEYTVFQKARGLQILMVRAVLCCEMVMYVRKFA